MIIRIQMFARARDLAGAEWVEVELPTGSTIGQLRRELGRRYPALEPLLRRSAIALNEEFAEETDELPADAKLAMLPPVSGGSSERTV
jgi:molybdopterin converting factor small subunit